MTDDLKKDILGSNEDIPGTVPSEELRKNMDDFSSRFLKNTRRRQKILRNS